MASLRRVGALTVVVMVMLLPVPALANVPLATGAVDYQIWMAPRPGQALVLVSVTVPPDTKLPVKVRVPVPPGMEVEWAGEISGRGTSSDIKRPFIKREGQGALYAEVELREHRKAQIDTSGKSFDVGASAVTVQFELAQSVLSEQSSFSVRIPRGASDVGIDPLPLGGPEVGQLGESLYRLPSKQLKPGEKTRVSVSYRMSSGAGSTAADPQRRNLVLLIVGTAALLVGVALFVALRRPARTARPAGPRRRRRR